MIRELSFGINNDDLQDLLEYQRRLREARLEQDIASFGAPERVNEALPDTRMSQQCSKMTPQKSKMSPLQPIKVRRIALKRTPQSSK